MIPQNCNSWSCRTRLGQNGNWTGWFRRHYGLWLPWFWILHLFRWHICRKVRLQEAHDWYSRLAPHQCSDVSSLEKTALYMKKKKYSETQNRKNLKIFEIWKMKIVSEIFQNFWKSFLIKISANFAHDDASSLYPISRDEFRTTVTIFRFAQNNLQLKLITNSSTWASNHASWGDSHIEVETVTIGNFRHETNRNNDFCQI